MAIDQAWVTELRAMKDLETRDTLKINDVEIVLPKKSARGKELIRDWQRRLLPDIIPDSVNADAPDVTVELVEVHDDAVGPLGVKGVGEIGMVGTAAAIANAVFHATGRRVRKLPMAPELVMDAPTPAP